MKLLNGNANMNFSNVHIAGMDIEHELKAIGGSRKSGQARSGTDIQHLTGQFAVRNGVAQTNDLQAVLSIGKVAAAGTVNLSSNALNFRATAVLSVSAGREAGIGSVVAGTVRTALNNPRGEFVIPGIITGTLEHPKFEPDMEQLALMQMKGLVPTSDNPFGVLGNLLGHGNQNETGQKPVHNPVQGIGRELGKFFSGKK
jgi:hypothetical protein